MPRFYFDILDGAVHRDDAGTDLPSTEVARAHSLQVAAAWAGAPAMVGREAGSVVVEVRDEHRRPLLTTRLAFDIQAR